MADTTLAPTHPSFDSTRTLSQQPDSVKAGAATHPRRIQPTKSKAASQDRVAKNLKLARRLLGGPLPRQLAESLASLSSEIDLALFDGVVFAQPDGCLEYLVENVGILSAPHQVVTYCDMVKPAQHFWPRLKKHAVANRRQ